MPNATLRSRLIANLQNPDKQRQYRRDGFAYAGKVQKGMLVRGKIHDGRPTAHDACASVASQPVLDLGLIHHPEAGAEALQHRMKQTKVFIGTSDLDSAQEGDCVVCQDGNSNGVSDHIWWIVRILGGGWFECLDNQGRLLTYRRRLDGDDGRTRSRGLLRLNA